MLRQTGVAFLFLTILIAGVGAVGAEKEPASRVNINTAGAEELAKLPGVGEVIAQRIIRHREISGPFRSVNELLVIRGISRKKLEALRPLVTVKGKEEQRQGKAGE